MHENLKPTFKTIPTLLTGALTYIPGSKWIISKASERPLRYMPAGFFGANMCFVLGFSMYDPYSLTAAGVGAVNDLVFIRYGRGGNLNLLSNQQLRIAQRAERTGQLLTSLSGGIYFASGYINNNSWLMFAGVCTIGGAAIGFLNKPRDNPSNFSDVKRSLLNGGIKEATMHLVKVAPYKKSALVWMTGALSLTHLFWEPLDARAQILIGTAILGHMVSNSLVYISQKANPKRVSLSAATVGPA